MIGAGEQGSRGAGEQGSRGAGEQGSRGAGEQGSRGSRGDALLIMFGLSGRDSLSSRTNDDPFLSSRPKARRAVAEGPVPYA